ncbi:hypothetical protein SAMN04488511_11835 [Pedobacter suwonensis]|uniref:Uncharacterized protein n=1 Tax=Pedobacter suwonensis TaxID=332999 RepID=A0A1I0U1E9_9SPHI|nr:hypothetical protein SAMN04488511_11835 [Pedobacter suwonensis]
MENEIQSDRDIQCEFLNIFKFIWAACGIAPLGEISAGSEPEMQILNLHK